MNTNNSKQSAAWKWLYREPEDPEELCGPPSMLVVRVARDENDSSTR